MMIWSALAKRELQATPLQTGKEFVHFRWNALMLFDFQSFWSEQAPTVVFISLSFLFYLVGLVIGRWLKRKLNVALGWTSHLCIACLSVMAASQILQVTFPGKKAVGLLAVVAAAFPINALPHRFVWPIYGYPGEKSRIPSFLPQVAGIIGVSMPSGRRSLRDMQIARLIRFGVNIKTRCAAHIVWSTTACCFRITS